MKKGQGLDSFKAIVLGVFTVAFLTHSSGMGRAITLFLPFLPNAEASSEFTLTETRLEEVRIDRNMSLSEFGFIAMEAREPIQYSPASLTLRNSQIPLQTPTRPAFRPGRKDNTFFITALTSTVLVQTADYLTTLNALKYRSLQEGNPLLRNIVDDPLLFGAVKLCMTGLEILLLKKLYDNNKTLGWIAATAMNFAVSYIVANNISKIQRAQNL